MKRNIDVMSTREILYLIGVVLPSVLLSVLLLWLGMIIDDMMRIGATMTRKVAIIEGQPKNSTVMMAVVAVALANTALIINYTSLRVLLWD